MCFLSFYFISRTEIVSLCTSVKYMKNFSLNSMISFLWRVSRTPSLYTIYPLGFQPWLLGKNRGNSVLSFLHGRKAHIDFSGLFRNDFQRLPIKIVLCFFFMFISKGWQSQYVRKQNKTSVNNNAVFIYP